MLAGLPACAFVLAVALPSAGAGEIVTNLDELPGRLPYECVADPHFEALPRAPGLPFVTGDLDQDGWDELVLAAGEGFVGWDWEGGIPRVLWQENYPVEFLTEGRAEMVTLFGCEDVDDDGRPEVLLTAATAERTRWRLWAYDPGRQANDLDLPLPAGPDLKPDGYWDGHLRILGRLEAGETGRGAALLLTVQVGYDLEPRGLVALSIPEGTILWRARLGPNPDWRSCALADVDGDGARDVIVVAGTSNNMPPGALVEGTRDDQCILCRYDLGGQRRWWRELGRGIWGAALGVADLDGDGAREIVTGDHNWNPGGVATIRVWNAEGELLGQKVLEGVVLDLAAVAAEGIYCGSTAGKLLHLVWREGRLTLAGRALGAGSVCLVAVGELIEEVAGPEVVAKTAAGRYVIMDRDLGPLATFVEPDGYLREIPGLIWNAGPGRRYLLLGDREVLARRLAPAANPEAIFGQEGPPSRSWGGLLAGIAAAAAAGGLAGRRLRRGRARARGQGAPATAAMGSDRERLAALLRGLEQSSHGAVAVTRGVRRLAWLLEALAADAEAGGGVVQRARETWIDFREATQPELLHVLALARGTPCGGRADEIGSALERFVAATERVLGQGPTAGEAREAAAALPLARQAAREVVDGFAELRREVEAYFTVDLRRLLDRVLLLREDELSGTGIAVKLAPEMLASLPCRADPADLRFAVDNLIGNAADAMLGGRTRELGLAIGTSDGQGFLEVADTGHGIEPERRRALFEPRGGGRRGLGLGRSRELLRRWGGDVELLESEVGRGSRFRLRVPLADGTGGTAAGAGAATAPAGAEAAAGAEPSAGAQAAGWQDPKGREEPT